MRLFSRPCARSLLSCSKMLGLLHARTFTASLGEYLQPFVCDKPYPAHHCQAYPVWLQARSWAGTNSAGLSSLSSESGFLGFLSLFLVFFLSFLTGWLGRKKHKWQVLTKTHCHDSAGDDDDDDDASGVEVLLLPMPLKR